MRDGYLLELAIEVQVLGDLLAEAIDLLDGALELSVGLRVLLNLSLQDGNAVLELAALVIDVIPLGDLGIEALLERGDVLAQERVLSLALLKEGLEVSGLLLGRLELTTKVGNVLLCIEELVLELLNLTRAH